MKERLKHLLAANQRPKGKSGASISWGTAYSRVTPMVDQSPPTTNQIQGEDPEAGGKNQQPARLEMNTVRQKVTIGVRTGAALSDFDGGKGWTVHK